LLICSYCFGLFGHLSVFYSGITWGWRRRLLWGIPAWIIFVWLAIHGVSLIFGLEPCQLEGVAI